MIDALDGKIQKTNFSNKTQTDIETLITKIITSL